MPWIRHDNSHGSPLYQRYSHAVFQALLRATGKSKARPRNLEVILRNGGLSDGAFYMSPYTVRDIKPVLAELKTCFLDLAAGPVPAYVEAGDGIPELCQDFHLREFLHHLGALEHLRLNFASVPPKDAQSFLRWLAQDHVQAHNSYASPMTYLKPPSSVAFPNLTNLDIGSVIVELTPLLAVVSKFRNTLRSISLNKTGLCSKASESERVNLWQKFFSKLAVMKLGLESVNARQLSQALSTNQFAVGTSFRTTFKDSGDTVSWAGKASCDSLQRIAQSIEVHWPPAIRSSDDEDDDEDDDEVDDDDDNDAEDDDNDEEEEG
jgi:hypothetical protein